MADKGNKMDGINERKVEDIKRPKIFNFITYKNGKLMYGSVQKYKRAIEAIDKINQELKDVLSRAERGVSDDTNSDGDSK